jgi:predicted ATPase
MGAGSVSRGDAGLVLERELELTRIEALVAELAGGEGQLMALEGSGGIGKTTLLVQARDRARSAGVRVLNAQASELERDFAFGLARQWLEPVLRTAATDERERLLSGAAALAAPVLLDAPGQPAGPGSPREPGASERVLHGLYWLIATVAESVPVLLVVDDAQWADEPSLRLLNFLATRLEGVGVSLLLACRPPELHEPGMLLARLLSDPRCTLIRPRPLTEAGAAAILGGLLGAEPERRFLAACQQATGGNPFYLRQVAAALDREEIAPTDEHAGRLARLSPPDLSRAILTRLSPAARTVAQALAVLDGPSEPSLVAAVAGTAPGEAAAAVAELARGGLIADRRPLRFVHAIVQNALLSSLAASNRAALHARRPPSFEPPEPDLSGSRCTCSRASPARTRRPTRR